MKRAFCFLLFFVVQTGIQAADGVVEINQTCALNGGCLSGDSGDFPVTISLAGSYTLTGNLDLRAIPGVNAIEITTDGVTLNMGGFRIVGPVTCGGTPGVDFGCTQNDSDANGVYIAPAVGGASVLDGTIQGVPGNGILGSDSEATRISNVMVTENGIFGVRVKTE